jgi:hypothetical protein
MELKLNSSYFQPLLSSRPILAHTSSPSLTHIDRRTDYHPYPFWLTLIAGLTAIHTQSNWHWLPGRLPSIPSLSHINRRTDYHPYPVLLTSLHRFTHDCCFTTWKPQTWYVYLLYLTYYLSWQRYNSYDLSVLKSTFCFTWYVCIFNFLFCLTYVLLYTRLVSF